MFMDIGQTDRWANRWMDRQTDVRQKVIRRAHLISAQVIKKKCG